MKPQYIVGDEVVKINNPNEKGIIIEVNPLRRGLQTYRVRFQNSVETELEQDLKTISDNTNPFELLKKHIFFSFIDFQKKNTSVKIRNTSNNTISSLKASRTIFQPYQYKPLLKFINSDKKRLLIADEVGLGKTIEAGHIILELIGRRELKNCLIICPKSLTEKWKDELQNRFNLYFKIYQNKNDVIEDLNFRPNDFKGILNYEKLRISKKTNNINSKQTNLINFIEESNIKFNFLVCDESHKLRNKTLTSRGIERILKQTDGAIFLTATPIMTETKNLFNQLQLLDPEVYWNFVVFENQDKINRPIIKALNQLNNNIDFHSIANELESNKISINFYDEKNIKENEKQNKFGSTYSYITDYLKEDKLFQNVISDLKTLDNSVENRVKIQHNLSLLNTLNTIFTRTRKKDVTIDWSNAIRSPKPIFVKLSYNEWELHTSIIDKYEEENSGTNYTLGLIQISRQLSSSLYAYIAKESQLEFDEFINEEDSKYEKLKDIINEVVINNRRKLIVFATFKATLSYIQTRLLNEGFKTVLISGDVDQRNEIITKFRNDPTIPVLLSSEVGSEGVDLQFCDSIVNYDLPWNPMIVEQRIGRVHRFGQKSPIVNIFTIITENSIEKDIYERLLDRIGIFKASIGDLEPILVDKDGSDLLKGLDKILYSKSLSLSQKREKIDDIARAIEQRKIDIKEINTGLNDSITNDIYFENEIKRINENYKYVAENELKNYLKSIFTSFLPTLNLVETNENIFKIIIPKNEKNILINFLNENGPDNTEFDNIKLHNSFINEIRNNFEIIISFNQEVAYENKSIIYINAYHPIILSIKRYYDKQQIKCNTYNFSLSKDFGFTSGVFIMCVYSLIITKENINETKNIEILVPIVFDTHKKEIINDENLSERMLGYSQQFAKANSIEISINEEIMNDIELDITVAISEKSKKIENEEKIKLNSQITRRFQQDKLFYDYRIHQIKNSIEEIKTTTQFDDSEEARRKRSIIPLMEKTILKMKEELEEKERYFNSFRLYVKTELLSISYVNII